MPRDLGKRTEIRADSPDRPEGRSLNPGKQLHLLYPEGDHAGYNVDPKSQTDRVQDAMRAARYQMHLMKTKITAPRGEPKEFEPGYGPMLIAGRNFEADIKQMSDEEKFGGARRTFTGATLVGSSSQEAEPSSADHPHSQQYYSSSDGEDYEVVTNKATLGFLLQPEQIHPEQKFNTVKKGDLIHRVPAPDTEIDPNSRKTGPQQKFRTTIKKGDFTYPDTEIDPKDCDEYPNDLDSYQRKLVGEGYHPAPAQSFLKALCNYFSPNSQRAEHLVKLKASEQKRDECKEKMDRSTEAELMFAKGIAELMFDEDIKKSRKYLNDNKGEAETKKYKRKEDKLEDLKKRRGDLEADIRKSLSENTGRSYEVFVQDLETIAEGHKMKLPSFFKVSSLFRFGGLY